ncbi:hypothetical protein I656_03824 [Geobacillus sp. WSUCF1]|nr:hypothetical protein I656_03824 [Geobacillus sp. WSUCF1]
MPRAPPKAAMKRSFVSHSSPPVYENALSLYRTLACLAIGKTRRGQAACEFEKTFFLLFHLAIMV